MNETPETVFARRMRERRLELGLTQPGLARRVSELLGSDLTATAITKIERGQRAVRVNESVYIAQALDVPIWWLVSEVDPDDARLQELMVALQEQSDVLRAAELEVERAQRAIDGITDELDEIQAAHAHAVSNRTDDQPE